MIRKATRYSVTIASLILDIIGAGLVSAASFARAKLAAAITKYQSRNAALGAC